MIIVKLFSHISSHVIDFVELFLFQLFDKIKSSFFVICHVLIPGISKLVVLKSLGIFNVHKLSLLGYPHVVMLSLLLIAAPPVEHSFEIISHHVVALALVPLSHLVHNFEKGNDSLVREKVDARLRQQGPVSFLVSFENRKLR